MHCTPRLATRPPITQLYLRGVHAVHEEEPPWEEETGAEGKSGPRSQAGTRMRTGLTLAPGQRGTKKLAARYGDRLVCVRYRYDEDGERRLKTAEIIVEEAPYLSRRKAERPVGVKVLWGERTLQCAVKKAGGRWDKNLSLWRLSYGAALALGLRHRIVPLKKGEKKP